jgi:hypothetical protein
MGLSTIAPPENLTNETSVLINSSMLNLIWKTKVQYLQEQKNYTMKNIKTMNF